MHYNLYMKKPRIFNENQKKINVLRLQLWRLKNIEKARILNNKKYSIKKPLTEDQKAKRKIYQKTYRDKQIKIKVAEQNRIFDEVTKTYREGYVA